MEIILEEALRWANLPFSVLLVVCLLYWLSVIVGAFDAGSLDFDLDADVDLDVDSDAHINKDLSGSGGGGLLRALASAINIGRVPFMLVMTILVLSLWTSSMLYNYYLMGLGWWIALALLVPNFILGLLLTKLITTPLATLFRGFHQNAKPRNYIGTTGVVVVAANHTTTGQAKVRINNAVDQISIRALDPNELLTKNSQVIITQSIDSDGYYLAKLIPEN